MKTPTVFNFILLVTTFFLATVSSTSQIAANKVDSLSRELPPIFADVDGEQQIGKLHDIRRLTNEQPLSRLDQLEILNTAARYLRLLNPNLSLQRKVLRVNVFNRIQTLRRNLHNYTTPFAFHLQMTRIFNSLDDGHTSYTPPLPMYRAFGALGFFVERAFDNGVESFIFSRKWAHMPFEHDTFVPGVTILEVDGKPVREIVLNLGKKSNANQFEDTLIRWGQLYLTFRLITAVGIVTKPTIVFTYLDLDGVSRNIDVPIRYVFYLENRFFRKIDPGVRSSVSQPTLGEESIRQHPLNDFSTPSLEEPMKILHSKDEDDNLPIVQSERALNTRFHKEVSRTGKIFISKDIVIEQGFTEFFSAKNITTGDTSYTALTIRSFFPDSNTVSLRAWFEEARRLLQISNQERLLIDVRANNGGFSVLSLALMEALTNDSIVVPRYPEHIRTSALAELILTSLGIPGSESLKSHAAAGYDLSGPTFDSFGIAAPFERNQRQGQTYFGKVVVLTSAASASATELFVSLAKDIHGQTVIGLDSRTAGLGASTISNSFLSGSTPFAFQPLPNGVDLSTAYARFFRSGASDGTLVEYFGIQVDDVYRETTRDLIARGLDMYEFIANKF